MGTLSFLPPEHSYNMRNSRSTWRALSSCQERLQQSLQLVLRLLAAHSIAAPHVSRDFTGDIGAFPSSCLSATPPDKVSKKQWDCSYPDFLSSPQLKDKFGNTVFQCILTYIFLNNYRGGHTMFAVLENYTHHRL